jgi:hypothetical protein
MRLRRKPFGKIIFFGKCYKFISGFPRFLDVLIGQKPCWKAAAYVFKLFWKPISKTLKGFGKPLKNHI